jgi:hypothetical protein
MNDGQRGEHEQSIELINEFASVCVRKVLTRNGERLEVSSPRLGYRIQLDALALEGLTWQTMETFTRFLETPFGPHEYGGGDAPGAPAAGRR